MYLVDANVLIEAKNRCYAFDVAPGFWDWSDHAHANSLACSIDAVKQELLAGADELGDWARAHTEFFQPLDQPTTAQLRDLSTWANSAQHTQAAINASASNAADHLLVAHARAHGRTLATHERSQPNSKKRVLIPDACLAMGGRVRRHFHHAAENPRSSGTRYAVDPAIASARGSIASTLVCSASRLFRPAALAARACSGMP